MIKPTDKVKNNAISLVTTFGVTIGTCLGLFYIAWTGMSRLDYEGFLLSTYLFAAAPVIGLAIGTATGIVTHKYLRKRRLGHAFPNFNEIKDDACKTERNAVSTLSLIVACGVYAAFHIVTYYSAEAGFWSALFGGEQTDSAASFVGAVLSMAMGIVTFIVSHDHFKDLNRNSA